MKRFIYVLAILLVCNPLFAFTAGDNVLYPLINFGVSGGDVKAYKGSEVGLYMAGDPTLFDDAEIEPSLAYSLGGMFDYFLTDTFALSVGLLYEKAPVKVVYPKNTASEDLEFILDTSFLTIPIGAHFYSGILVVGGGLYLGAILTDDAEIKYGSTTLDVELEETNNDLGFFIDLGVNIDLSEESNLLLYARYKRGFVNIYDEEDVITDIQIRTLTLNVAYGIRL